MLVRIPKMLETVCINFSGLPVDMFAGINIVGTATARLHVIRRAFHLNFFLPRLLFHQKQDMSNFRLNFVPTESSRPKTDDRSGD
jgi:hypothetical protein